MKNIEVKKLLLDTNLFEENAQLDNYCQLVADNEATKYDRLRTQSHHIIPRFCFKFTNIERGDSAKNRVNLLYKDHILAHYYLSQCIKEQYYHNAFSAVLFLIRDSNQFNKFDINNLDNYQENYEKYKISYSQDEEIKRKKSLKLKGLKRTEETKQLISINSTGKNKSYSEESREQHSKALKGNKNRLGSKHSLSSREQISINNKGKPKPGTSKKLKGKPKSPDHVLKMSISHRGKKFSDSTRKNMSKSQLNRDPSTKAYKWIYYYDNKQFRGEREVLEYLNSKGFNMGPTCLNNIIKGNVNAKYYKELYYKIRRERNKEFNYKK